MLFRKHRKADSVKRIATYTKEQRDEIDRVLAQKSEQELNALDAQGGKIIYQAKDTAKYNQREYMRRYRQRLALAAEMGIIKQGGGNE